MGHAHKYHPKAEPGARCIIGGCEHRMQKRAPPSADKTPRKSRQRKPDEGYDRMQRRGEDR